MNICEICNGNNIKCYTEVDPVTNEFIGYVYLCDECAETYEEISGTTIILE